MKPTTTPLPAFLPTLGYILGLMACIALITLAVWKGIAAIEGNLNTKHEAYLAAAEAGGVRTFNLDAFALEFREEAVKRAKENVENNIAEAKAIAESQAAKDIAEAKDIAILKDIAEWKDLKRRYETEAAKESDPVAKRDWQNDVLTADRIIAQLTELLTR